MGFVMQKIRGEALPHKLLKDPQYKMAMAALTQEAAASLAHIHKVEPSQLPTDLPMITPLDALRAQEKIYRNLGAKVPVFDLVIGWLERHAPTLETLSLVHGDFRLGNLLVDEKGLTAVLDWELSHKGDPVRDVAYLCTPSWRFGRYEKHAGGFDSQQNWLEAYGNASGTKVDIERFRWWLLFNTLWWGVSCLLMGRAYRDGTVKSLERTLIGKRVSEVEIDLLLQFEEIKSIKTSPLKWAAPDLMPAVAEMSYSEIAEAVKDWNKTEVQTELSGLDLFKSRMAGNALGILQRQAAWGQGFAANQSARLTALKLTQTQICAQCRTDNKAADTAQLWDHLRLTAFERISIDQPKYAGFKIATERWTS